MRGKGHKGSARHLVLWGCVMGLVSGVPVWAAAQLVDGRQGKSDAVGGGSQPIFESWRFDTDEEGATPNAFSINTLGEGAKSKWTIARDPSAPSAPYVLRHEAACSGDRCFHVALADQTRYEHVDASVRLRQLETNGAPTRGGLVLCAKDDQNFYAVTLDVANKTLEIIRVLDGESTVLGHETVKLKSKPWHTIRVQRNTIFSKEYLEAHIDDQLILGVWDGELRSGKIGLITVGNGAMMFDNLSSIRLQETEPLSPPAAY